MTPEDTFDVVAEIRILRKEFELFKENHESRATERERNITQQIDELKALFGKFTEKCLGSKHEEDVKRHDWHIRLLWGASVLLASAMGVGDFIIKLISK